MCKLDRVVGGVGGGGGVTGEGASALGVCATQQQQPELRGDAAGERRVDPGVGARV